MCFTPKNEASDSHKLDFYQNNSVVDFPGVSEKFSHLSTFFDEKSQF